MKRLNKKVLVCMMSFVAALCMSISAFAETTGSANTAVTTAMTSVANDMTATATAIIPVALTVVGISMVVVFGIKVFKRITYKG